MSDADARADPATGPELDREREPLDVVEAAADARSVESDPAYAPDDEELRRLKGA